MQVTKLTRVFSYNGMELADPDPSVSPNKVAEFYSALYPELAVCTVNEGVISGDKQIFTFTKAAGSKSWTKPL
ncbi:PRTRC system protein C [Flavobacterium sp.]|uniref:PRTRC system protein C n=1 Tax=Flavobacterium sp. TaxID=239 RepID=UPI0026116059|nr:PRTRC system protein C [Flavobacterium sp.]